VWPLLIMFMPAVLLTAPALLGPGSAAS
jgi:hypothetical protein